MHLDVGAVADLYQSLFPSNLYGGFYFGEQRAGARLGIGLLTKYTGLTLLADLFPYRLYCIIPEGCGDSSPDYEVQYRVTALVTVGI